MGVTGAGYVQSPLTGRPRVVGVRFNVTDNRHGSNSVSSVAFKPGDSDTLVSGSVDTTIKIWHLPSGECQATFKGHRYIFCAVTCMGSLGDPSTPIGRRRLAVMK